MNTLKEYSTMFEYVLGIVSSFINDQEKVYSGDASSEMFDEGAWLFNFFTINPERLTVKEVQDSIKSLLSSSIVNGTEQKPYNTALARVHGLFATLYAAAGSDYMRQLQNNVVDSIVALHVAEGRKEKVIRKSVTDLFNAYPILVISIVGSSYFAQRCVEARRQKRLATLVK